MLLLTSGERPLHDGDQRAEAQEAADGQREHTGRNIGRRHDPDAEQRARAQELTERAQDQQHHRVADALADAVHRGGGNGVLAGKGLGAAEDDAVDDDQRNEHAKALGDVREKRLQAQINDRNEARDDDDVARDTHFIRNDFAQKGNKDVGKRQDDENGDAHAKAVCNARGDGHGGAHTEHLHQNGVLVDQTVFELFVKIHRSFPLSQFMASAAARAALTPLVTPLVETVAPVTASMFCLTTSVPAPDLPTN